MFMEQDGIEIHENERKTRPILHQAWLIKNLLYRKENATFLRDTPGNPKRAR